MSGRIRHGRAGRPCPVLRPKYLDNPPPVLRFAIPQSLANNPYHVLTDDNEYRLNRVQLSPSVTVLTTSKNATEFLQNSSHSLFVQPTRTTISDTTEQPKVPIIHRNNVYNGYSPTCIALQQNPVYADLSSSTNLKLKELCLPPSINRLSSNIHGSN